jgi:hypothetical protein
LIEVTLASVKKQLAAEEHARAETREVLRGEMTPSAFVIAGLELEEIQYVLLEYFCVI